jgi:uncharacterized protein involved in exopolysaccharide biosynthesis
MNAERITVNSAEQDNTLAELLGRVVSLVWRRKFLFLIVGIVVFLISASVSFLLPEYFVARATILPAPNSGGLSSLMSRFGSLPMVSELGLGSSGTQLYPSIAKSELVIGNILESGFEGQTVLSFLSKDGPTDSLAVYLITQEFRKAISTNINLRNDIVTVEYGNKNKYFAAFVVNSVVDNMEKYLCANSHNEVIQQMETIELRLEEVTSNMNKSEKKLLEFWNNNRSINQSPSLRIQEKSLLRQQDINSGLYLELVRQRELIKIQSTGKAPILTVLDSAKVPMVRSSPNRVKIVALSMFLALATLLALLYLKEDKAEKYSTAGKD